MTKWEGVNLGSILRDIINECPLKAFSETGRHRSCFCVPGPAALDIAWIGAGSSDAFFHFGIHCWDMAAGN